ncbi:transcriptional regulator/antitoxin, MazE [Gloeomargarita lithophora Alchichica-D10]|uniref:Transcriptional regulator/antitoxin, MazE n=1 Tax=Gloeomargarita lithophora Alchichica-D10 TaxID=1188229 RepID=A0A1J0AGV6_9CYAN|nr:AbrB/MazE/SpoVT family DNA-binding domain-containing protein [Gloeomargarita lithophora]APB35123.1 transcriptional regulator/antitoxin, MazE [Gloeomargarita lithophora Alchichica-D10]
MVMYIHWLYQRFSQAMFAKVQKWGNSQGLRLSKDVLALAGMAVGDAVEISVDSQQIVIKKASRSKKYDLAALVERIPENYPVQEVDFGAPVGRETW